MKNFIKSLALLACLSTATVSCESFLDQPVLGKENLDTYFYTEAECENALVGCYNSVMFQDWWQVARMYILMDACTDDMWYGNTTQDASAWYNINHFGGSAGNSNIMVQNYWQYRYQGILRCNLVIERVPEAEKVSQDAKDRIVAQAKFIRGFQYFELVKCFGGVPVLDRLKMPSEVNGIQRETLDSCYKFIEKDFTEAMEFLPVKSEWAASDMGRITKGAAQAYLGKAYLYQEKFQEAYDMFDKVIQSGEYDLLDKFEEVYTIGANNGVESIFEQQTSNDIQYNLGTRIPVVMGSRDDSGWSWGQPSSDLENAFIAAGDDIRLEATIIKHGDTHINGEDEVNEENPYVVTPSKHKSGRVTGKLYIPKALRPSSGFDGNHNNLNIRLMRYADLLLMYAEAANATGSDSEAQWALNKVRTRVQLPDVTATGTELRDAIRNERRLELALEFHRLFDIRRWKNDAGHSVMSDIMGPDGSFVKYNTETSTDEFETTNTKEPQDKGINFVESRDLLFPIPESEIALSNYSIEQNPGY